MKCIEASELYRLILDELDPDRAAAIEHHLGHCERCASAWNEVQRLVGHLAPDEGEFDDPAFAGDVMTLVRLGRTQKKEPHPSWWEALVGRWRAGLATALVAAATASLVLLVWPRPEGPDSGFQSRGGAESPDSWVSIQAYRAAGTAHQPISSALAADDALAFTYSNRSRGVYRFLMILGVDRTGHVFWYYPAYTRAGEDPASVPISSSENPQTLPQQVRHDLRPGELRLFGLFSRAPLRVHQVEAVVATSLQAAGSLRQLQRLPLEGTGQHSFIVAVTAAPGPGSAP